MCRLVYILLGSFVWTGADATLCNGTLSCCSPALPTETAGDVRQITDSKELYSVDEVVGYFCENKNGHLSRTCQGSDVWSDVDRTCDDTLPFSKGSIAGICFAAFNIALEVTLIVLATKLMKKREQEEEVEMRIREAAEASRA